MVNLLDLYVLKSTIAMKNELFQKKRSKFGLLCAIYGVVRVIIYMSIK